jgi:hypothetical protein
MPSQEEKARRRVHRNKKKQDRVRSQIAKDLITSRAYKQQIVEDKKKLQNLSHKELTELIQETDLTNE